MQANEIQWSSQEKAIAQTAINTALTRETQTLIQTVRQQAQTIDKVDDLWKLHDFLSARRHSLDGKYDNRESGLIFVLSELVREGWLSLDELGDLDTSKLTKIKALTSFF